MFCVFISCVVCVFSLISSHYPFNIPFLPSCLPPLPLKCLTTAVHILTSLSSLSLSFSSSHSFILLLHLSILPPLHHFFLIFIFLHVFLPSVFRLLHSSFPLHISLIHYPFLIYFLHISYLYPYPCLLHPSLSSFTVTPSSLLFILLLPSFLPSFLSFSHPSPLTIHRCSSSFSFLPFVITSFYFNSFIAALHPSVSLFLPSSSRSAAFPLTFLAIN